MKRMMLAGLFILWTAVALADINAQLSESEVSLGQTFKLTLTQDSAQDPGLPNLTALQKDFNILGTERTVSYTLINGQASSLSQWTITLSAKKEGQLRIPAIAIDGQSSNPLEIKVHSEGQGSKPKQQKSLTTGEAVKLITEVNTDRPYINQEVIYTVKLLTRQRLLDADYQGPHVEDALMVPLGNGKRYQTVVNDQVYAVEEQRYAVFPQKSGKIRIHPPVFKALVYDAIPKRIKATDKTINLNVKPAPANFKGKHWLAAKEVSLSEDYDKPTLEFTQGDILVRTVRINSIGTPAQLLPKLAFNDSDKFNIYPENPIEENIFRQQQLVGLSTTKVTYLFSKPGKLTIPELRLHWFNTETGKEEVVVLPSRTLTVKPSTVPQNTVSSPSDTQRNEQPVKAADKKSVTKTTSSSSFTIAWIMAFIFALAWLLTMFLWLGRGRSRGQARKAQNAALASLKEACQQNNPQHARTALLQWAGYQWPEATFLNLTELAKFVRDSQFKKQINLLSQSLYSKPIKSSWDGRDLWTAVISYKKKKGAKKSRSNALPPINPFN